MVFGLLICLKSNIVLVLFFFIDGCSIIKFLYYLFFVIIICCNVQLLEIVIYLDILEEIKMVSLELLIRLERSFDDILNEVLSLFVILFKRFSFEKNVFN